MTRRGTAAAPAAALLALAPGRALAHGGVTGVQDVVQDNLVLVFLLAVVLIGAGVLAWVLLSPPPEVEAEEGAGDEPG